MTCSVHVGDITCVPTGTGVVLMARVALLSGELVKQADLSEITYEVRLGSAVIDNDSLVIEEVIYDELVDDDTRWTIDDVGYNVAWEVPHALLEAEGAYRVTVTLMPVEGSPVKVSWSVIADAS